MTISLPPIPGFGSGPTVTSLSFNLLRQIGTGQGLNSVVFLAHDLQFDTQLAVKRVPKTNLPNPDQYFAEARRLYDARHKHVVDVRYACQDASYIYLAMPFYREGTLQDLIEQRYLTVREIVRYGIEFLSGLHHVNVRGLVHFDVKPTNVFLDDSHTATLADFGLSREVDPQGRVVITTAYRRHIPPEWLVSGRVSRQADVSQAGMTLYRMSAGAREFERQVVQHDVDADHQATAIAAGAFPERGRFLEHVPNALRTAIGIALETDVAKRYGTVLDLANALGRVNESLDWVYQEGASWGAGSWSESGQGSGRLVSLTQTGGVWDVHACRVSSTGRQRRFLPFCASGLPERTARRLVRRALVRNWR